MLLAPDQPLYALRPNAAAEHGDGYVPEKAAKEYARQIRSLQPEGPYLVAGWCAGAAVALEVGRLLLEAGQEVPLLAVFTPVLYSRFNNTLCTYVKSLWSLPVRRKLDRIRRTLRGLIEDIHQGALRRLSQMSSRAHGQARQAREEISRAVQETNRRALRRHSRLAYPGRVTLFLTDDTVSSVASSTNVEATFGKMAAGGLEVYKVSGDHASVVRDPHVRDLANKLRCCVDKVTTS
jgi:aspartate racemase